MTNFAHVFFAGATALFGFLTWLVYREIRDHARDVERAWISLETLDVEVLPDHTRTLVIGFRNSGRTPAYILEANVTIRSATWIDDGHHRASTLEYLTKIPETPEYDGGEYRPPAIIVAGELSRWRHRVTTYIGQPTNEGGHAHGFLMMTPGHEGEQQLWIYGFVHFRDVFGRPHEYRWAREYDRALSKARKTFAFAHMNKPGYDYAD